MAKLTAPQLAQWRRDRARVAAQHPGPSVGSRGDHYRRKNTGIAYRTFLEIRRGSLGSIEHDILEAVDEEEEERQPYLFFFDPAAQTEAANVSPEIWIVPVEGDGFMEGFCFGSGDTAAAAIGSAWETVRRLAEQLADLEKKVSPAAPRDRTLNLRARPPTRPRPRPPTRTARAAVCEHQGGRCPYECACCCAHCWPVRPEEE